MFVLCLYHREIIVQNSYFYHSTTTAYKTWHLLVILWVAINLLGVLLMSFDWKNVIVSFKP